MTSPIAHPLQANDRVENLIVDIFQAITIALTAALGVLTVAASL